VYARNLTVGSRGADVTALQNHLIAKGYLASTATGYFGGLTKSALVKLQKEMGLPSTGYFGPMTRGALNK
jgi:N-acetylmuramoyl-L-alanine amidase